MPVIKSAKKAMRQAIKRTERNKATRSMLKTYVKKVLTLSKAGSEDAAKLLPKAYKVIDTAAKKNIIHKNNAARKKSNLAKAVANIGKTPVATKAPAKASKAAKAKGGKKTTAKKTKKKA